jgi:hypothetical protein
VGDGGNVSCVDLDLVPVPFSTRPPHGSGSKWQGDIILNDPDFGTVFLAGARVEQGRMGKFVGLVGPDGPTLLPEPYRRIGTDEHECDTDCIWVVEHGAGFDREGRLYLAWGYMGGGASEDHTATIDLWTGTGFEEIATFWGNYGGTISGPFINNAGDIILLSLLWLDDVPLEGVTYVSRVGWVNVWNGTTWDQLTVDGSEPLMIDQSRSYLDANRALFVSAYQGNTEVVYEVSDRQLVPRTPCHLPPADVRDTLGHSGFSEGGMGGDAP